MPAISASLLCKVLTVFLLFCLTKANGGTCLSYGHSCWGGHGKRNGAPGIVGAAGQKRMGSWYVSKLFSPSLEKSNRLSTPYMNNANQEESDVEKFQKYGYQVYPILDVAEVNAREDMKDSDMDLKPVKWGLDSRDLDEEMFVMTPEIQHVPIPKYKFYQFMDRGNDKRRLEN